MLTSLCCNTFFHFHCYFNVSWRNIAILTQYVEHNTSPEQNNHQSGCAHNGNDLFFDPQMLRQFFYFHICQIGLCNFIRFSEPMDNCIISAVRISFSIIPDRCCQTGKNLLFPLPTHWNLPPNLPQIPQGRHRRSHWIHPLS